MKQRLDLNDEIIMKQLESKHLLFPGIIFEKEDGTFSLLGAGGTSYVFAVQYQGQNCALKVCGLLSSPVDRDAFSSAISMQRKLAKQGHAVRILGVKELLLQVDFSCRVLECADITGKKADCNGKVLLQCILMERLIPILTENDFEEPSLFPKDLSNPDGEELEHLAFDIGTALLKAHKRNFLHRDVKLENIFWDPKRRSYKLGDFGIAKQTTDGMAKTKTVFTRGYGAPEVVLNLDEAYDATADLYSLGVVLFVIKNQLQFPGSDGYRANLDLQYAKGFIFPSIGEKTDAMIPLIQKLTAYDPDKRFPSANAFLEALYEKDVSAEMKVLRKFRPILLTVGLFSFFASILLWIAKDGSYVTIHYPFWIHIAIGCSVLRGMFSLVGKKNQKVFSAISVINVIVGVLWFLEKESTIFWEPLLFLIAGIFPISAMAEGAMVWILSFYRQMGRMQQWYQLRYQSIGSTLFYRAVCLAILFLAVYFLLCGRPRSIQWKHFVDFLCKRGKLWLILAFGFLCSYFYFEFFGWPNRFGYEITMFMIGAVKISFILCILLQILTLALSAYTTYGKQSKL